MALYLDLDLAELIVKSVQASLVGWRGVTEMVASPYLWRASWSLDGCHAGPERRCRGAYIRPVFSPGAEGGKAGVGGE